MRGCSMQKRATGSTSATLGGPLVVHLNPPDFEIALFLLGVSGRSRRLIAYWAWELPIVPKSWRRAFRLVHEVWAPSAFVAEAVKGGGLRAKVRVVPHP